MSSDKNREVVNNGELQSESSESSTQVSPDHVPRYDYWFCSFDLDQTLDYSEEINDMNRNPKNFRIPKSSEILPDYHLSIQLRNARERNRVRAVNEAFARLRKMIPYTAHRNKRVSKVKTLQKAVQYIAELRTLLNTKSPGNQ